MTVMEKVNILGVPVDKTDMKGALERINVLLDMDGTNTIYTPNSEMVINAVRDKELMEILKSGDLVVPDGIGLVYASKIYGNPLSERVTGFDLMTGMLKMLDREGRSVYLLGGKPGIAQRAADNIARNFPHLKIKGTGHGYFKEHDVSGIVEQINVSGAEVLLVALGSPKQEKWISSNLDRLKASIAMGVGGSFDVLAGEVGRAPLVFRRAGLEWFYRLITQPWRAARMLSLPAFVIKVLIDRGRRSRK